ncbi:MAG: single-stranded DNA-binding protein [Candidatus Omnitrophica bacterium]|nr:single-stranded DNA-binding protein [Candidatus Omnitrophota bacterium]
MASLNRVFLIGNLTRDPELRYIPSGAAVATIGLAVNTTIPMGAGNEPKTEVCFLRVVVWGKQAELCNQYLKKGRSVFIEGRLVYRSWEQDGKTRSTLEVKADRVQFLGPRRDEGAAAPEPAQELAQQEAGGDGPGEDEPPF